MKQEARGRISSFPSELKREFVRVMAARVEEVGAGEGKLQIFSFVFGPSFGTHCYCFMVFC